MQAKRMRATMRVAYERPLTKKEGLELTHGTEMKRPTWHNSQALKGGS